MQLRKNASLKVKMAHKNKSNYSAYKARQKDNPNEVAPEASLQGKHKRPESIYELEDASDRLEDIFRNHNFELESHAQRRQLAHFYRLLMLNQEHQNFTRLLKLRDVAIKHFIDSLIIIKHTKLQFPLLDVGTGPGFPGIPLKIAFPNEQVLLGEGVQKRVEFLKHVRSELKLEKLDIIGRNINPHCFYPINGAITRAVEDIPNTLSNVISALQLKGRVYFMKGPGVDPEIKLAKASPMMEFYKLVEDTAYSLPNTTHDRRLVVYEKIKHAPIPEGEPEDDLLLDELSSSEKKRWGELYK